MALPTSLKHPENQCLILIFAVSLSGKKGYQSHPTIKAPIAVQYRRKKYAMYIWAQSERV